MSMEEKTTVFTAKMEIRVPFSFCNECRFMDLEGITIYRDNRPFSSLHHCTHSEHCRHVIDLYKEYSELDYSEIGGRRGRFD